MFGNMQQQQGQGSMQGGSMSGGMMPGMMMMGPQAMYQNNPQADNNSVQAQNKGEELSQL